VSLTSFTTQCPLFHTLVPLITKQRRRNARQNKEWSHTIISSTISSTHCLHFFAAFGYQPQCLANPRIFIGKIRHKLLKTAFGGTVEYRVFTPCRLFKCLKCPARLFQFVDDAFFLFFVINFNIDFIKNVFFEVIEQPLHCFNINCNSLALSSKS
jgi:hypothetical protein